jgi:hypothetical protein
VKFVNCGFKPCEQISKLVLLRLYTPLASFLCIAALYPAGKHPDPSSYHNLILITLCETCLCSFSRL